MEGGIPSNEKPAVKLLLVYSLLAASSYALARTVGDSLFLSRVGSGNLASVFAISGLCTAALASAWFMLTQRTSLDRVIQASGITFALLSLGAWVLLPSYHHSIWLIGGVYLLTEIKGCVNTINIVSAMNSTLGSHSSKKSWARVGLGVPLAGILVGTLLGIEADFISLRTWLLASAALDVGSVVLVRNLKQVRVPDDEAADRSPSLDSVIRNAATRVRRLRRYTNTRQFRIWLGALIATKIIVLTLVSFEWKVAVDAFFHSEEAALTRFFGIYYAVIGLSTLLFQVALTGRLLSRRRLYVPILMMPISLLMINVTLLFGAGLLLVMILATAAKSLEVWRRSVHDTTLNMLYTSIERRKRRQVIAVNSAVVKPLAEVLASVVLLLGTATFDRQFLLVVTVLWLVSAVSLIRLLRRRASNPPALGHASVGSQSPRDPAQDDESFTLGEANPT